MMNEGIVSLKTIDWPAANAVVVGAMEKAMTLGLKLNVAVVDRGGHLCAFGRNAGSALHSISIAQDKAYSAVSFGFSTREWMDFLESFKSPALREGFLFRERLVVFGGGLPIYHQGTLIGGVGASGGSEEQDEECALAGLVAAGFSAEP
jgi:uncharacterized protein GlcG (DUF336 family)